MPAAIGGHSAMLRSTDDDDDDEDTTLTTLAWPSRSGSAKPTCIWAMWNEE